MGVCGGVVREHETEHVLGDFVGDSATGLLDGMGVGTDALDLFDEEVLFAGNFVGFAAHADNRAPNLVSRAVDLLTLVAHQLGETGSRRDHSTAHSHPHHARHLQVNTEHCLARKGKKKVDVCWASSSRGRSRKGVGFCTGFPGFSIASIKEKISVGVERV